MYYNTKNTTRMVPRDRVRRVWQGLGQSCSAMGPLATRCMWLARAPRCSRPCGRVPVWPVRRRRGARRSREVCSSRLRSCSVATRVCAGRGTRLFASESSPAGGSAGPDLEAALLQRPFKAFLLKVHPDLFQDSQQKTVNSESLAQLNALLDMVKSGAVAKARPQQQGSTTQQVLHFYYRKGQMGGEEKAAIDASVCKARFFLPSKSSPRALQRYVYKRLLYLLETTGTVAVEDWAHLRRQWSEEEREAAQAEDDAAANPFDGYGGTAKPDPELTEEQKRWRRIRQNPELDQLRRDPLAFHPNPRRAVMEQRLQKRKESTPEDFAVPELLAQGRIRFVSSLTAQQRTNCLGSLRAAASSYPDALEVSKWEPLQLRMVVGEEFDWNSRYVKVPWNFADVDKLVDAVHEHLKAREMVERQLREAHKREAKKQARAAHERGHSAAL